jgi:hypothetical protein
MQGRYARGWAEHEWRWQYRSFPASPRHTDSPSWRGDALAGRRLLTWAEQGLGDTLQFVRYTRLLAQRGANVVLEVQPELLRLMRESLPEVEVVARGTVPRRFDLQAPLLSLPHLLDTRVETIPADVPYLHAQPERVAAWAQRLGEPDGRLRVGLAWAGSPSFQNDRQRSLPVRHLAHLAEIPGVEWFSLQKNPAEPPPLELSDWTTELVDFADTAALMMHLDLVISVDTAVAHLAGALARPVWVLLPHPPDWRWFLDRTDSPWYPTARLFRQPRSADWSTVMHDLTAELESLKLQPSLRRSP